MQRREFIKTSCLGCVSILGASSLLSMLNSCTPLASIKTTINNNIITIPENTFIENQQLLVVKNIKLDFDILLVKKKDNTYNALYMKCSHQTQPLTATKSGLFCPSHGSSFNLDGDVTMQPATQALQKFKTEIKNNNINIYLN